MKSIMNNQSEDMQPKREEMTGGEKRQSPAEFLDDPEREESGQPDEGKDKKKRPGFGCGMIVGMLLMLVIALGGTKLYCTLSNSSLIIGSSSVAVSAGTDILDEDAVRKVGELASYISLYYYEDYDVAELQESLYKGLLDGLGDTYSVYYTKEEYESLQISTTGTYYGIGAGLSQDLETMEVTIVTVYENTPAEEAGLLEGDQILYVNDIEATSVELNDLVSEIRGEEGTTVHIQVYRSSADETLEFDVERRNVELSSVSSELLDGNIGYIAISEFQSNTGTQFKEALDELQEAGMEALIVDVRDNPGGVLTAVVDVLDYLLPEGTVVYVQDKYGNRKDYTSDADCLEIPLVVLINEDSASASEIFAGAIQDYEWGTLIGTTTYGKGIVQTIYPLSDGDAVKLTTAKYYTPSGNYIHGVGIEPDIELEYEYMGDGDTYEMQYDNQIQKAIEVLAGE